MPIFKVWIVINDFFKDDKKVCREVIEQIKEIIEELVSCWRIFQELFSKFLLEN